MEVDDLDRSASEETLTLWVVTSRFRASCEGGPRDIDSSVNDSEMQDYKLKGLTQFQLSSRKSSVSRCWGSFAVIR